METVEQSVDYHLSRLAERELQRGAAWVVTGHSPVDGSRACVTIQTPTTTSHYIMVLDPADVIAVEDLVIIGDGECPIPGEWVVVRY